MRYRLRRKILIWIFLILSQQQTLLALPLWGFFAHKKINELAVYTLPPDLMVFYKNNRESLLAYSVSPDKRRYVVKTEGPKHFLDLDALELSHPDSLPRDIMAANQKFSSKTLNEHGILPWNIDSLTTILTRAFYHHDWGKALLVSGEIGHYLADASVPLHTTTNYNGQFSDQYGIHGLWESQIPEYFFEDWILLTGKAEFLPNMTSTIFNLVWSSHRSVDSVFSMELSTERNFEKGKYTTMQRSSQIKKAYSREFCQEYQTSMNGMVERRMKLAIKTIGNIWYSCWVNAGQPFPPDKEKLVYTDSIEVITKETFLPDRIHEH